MIVLCKGIEFEGPWRAQPWEEGTIKRNIAQRGSNRAHGPPRGARYVLGCTSRGSGWSIDAGAAVCRYKYPALASAPSAVRPAISAAGTCRDQSSLSRMSSEIGNYSSIPNNSVKQTHQVSRQTVSSLLTLVSKKTAFNQGLLPDAPLLPPHPNPSSRCLTDHNEDCTTQRGPKLPNSIQAIGPLVLRAAPSKRLRYEMPICLVPL